MALIKGNVEDPRRLLLETCRRLEESLLFRQHYASEYIDGLMVNNVVEMLCGGQLYLLPRLNPG